MDYEAIVIGGTSPEALDVNDEAAVAAAVHEFLPDAEVVRTDAHAARAKREMLSTRPVA